MWESPYADTQKREPGDKRQRPGQLREISFYHVGTGAEIAKPPAGFRATRDQCAEEIEAQTIYNTQQITNRGSSHRAAAGAIDYSYSHYGFAQGTTKTGFENPEVEKGNDQIEATSG